MAVASSDDIKRMYDLLVSQYTSDRMERLRERAADQHERQQLRDQLSMNHTLLNDMKALLQQHMMVLLPSVAAQQSLRDTELQHERKLRMQLEQQVMDMKKQLAAITTATAAAAIPVPVPTPTGAAVAVPSSSAHKRAATDANVNNDNNDTTIRVKRERIDAPASHDSDTDHTINSNSTSNGHVNNTLPRLDVMSPRGGAPPSLVSPSMASAILHGHAHGVPLATPSLNGVGANGTNSDEYHRDLLAKLLAPLAMSMPMPSLLSNAAATTSRPQPPSHAVIVPPSPRTLNALAASFTAATPVPVPTPAVPALSPTSSSSNNNTAIVAAPSPPPPPPPPPSSSSSSSSGPAAAAPRVKLTVTRTAPNTACEICYRSKVRCDGERPCGRCERLHRGAMCVDRDPSLINRRRAAAAERAHGATAATAAAAATIATIIPNNHHHHHHHPTSSSINV